MLSTRILNIFAASLLSVVGSVTAASSFSLYAYASDASTGIGGLPMYYADGKPDPLNA
jgi:hypothetical protein